MSLCLGGFLCSSFYYTRENPFADPIHPQGGLPRDLTCRDLKSADLCEQVHGSPFLHTSLFCAPSIISQALRAAMVAAEVPLRGKLRAEIQNFHPPTPPASAFTNSCKHCCTGINLMLSAPNCPVLNPWAEVDVQTALVLLGACVRPRIRRRALRARPLHPRTTCVSVASRR